MKSFIYVTLLLIALSFCDDCSSKEKDKCTGSCKWTDGTAATCVKKTDCATATTTPSLTCADTTNCKVNDGSTACVSVATTCAVNTAGDACATPAAGCVFTAATQGKCAESSSDSAFGLKTSFLLIFLYFFF